MVSTLGLIPARAGSSRVKYKNIRPLAGHPLIAYTIQSALESRAFDRVIVSTDSELIAEIARYYGAEVPFLRPAELASTTSPDIEWLNHAFSHLNASYEAFSILRPTSPFRSADTLRRAEEHFLALEGIDSIRSVELCHEHPGKMWVLEDKIMQPLLDQSHLEIPYYGRQYQDLPKVYVQNSSVEFAWSRVVLEMNSREGKIIAPFFTDEYEGFSVDYERDWHLANYWLSTQEAALPPISLPPFKDERELAALLN